MTPLCYVVYAWYDENNVPYYVSKCRKGSTAMTRTRKSGLKAPADRKNIRVLFESFDEEEVLNRLDELQYEIGLADAAPGFGTLKNSISTSPAALRDRIGPSAIPVDVYTTDGEFRGSFPAVGVACSTLGLNQGNASGVLSGRLRQTGGYILTRRGQPIRGTVDWKPVERNQSVIAYDPKGQKHTFDCLADAADKIYNCRRGTSGIRRSLDTPHTNKSTALGWVFFKEDDEIPPYKEIVKRRRGRKSLQEMKHG
jgi:hypothetical protein